MNKRKFQLSNGYLLEFEQLARVLTVMAEQPELKKISKQTLCETTGLMERHIETLVSMGTAMGLIVPITQVLSSVGKLVVANDVFIESRATLEWCHYSGAGSYRNLVWFEVFNTLLPSGVSMTINEWMDKLRYQLAGEYTEKALGKNLREEVRFVVDAYLNKDFRKLELLHRADERIYMRRVIELTSHIFAAMIYDYAYESGARLIQAADLLNKPGSPGLLFAMDEPTLRTHLEELHKKGWLRYETTHNLNQVRLDDKFSALSFLRAHYGDKEPVPETDEKPSKTVLRNMFA